MRRMGLLIGLVLLMAGCAQGKAGGIAVINIDDVAKALGGDKAIEEKVQAHSQELSAKLDKIREDLKKTLVEEQAKLGTTPTAEQKQTFQQNFQRAQQAFNEQGQQAQQELNAFRLKQFNEFRDQVKPVAETIAKKMGASVVSTPATLLWFEPSQDITQKVIEDMKAHGAGAKPAASTATEKPAAP